MQNYYYNYSHFDLNNFTACVRHQYPFPSIDTCLVLGAVNVTTIGIRGLATIKASTIKFTLDIRST